MMMAVFFLLGGGLASFALWLAQTYANGASWLRARSRCPHCGKNLCAYDMIPVFSYLLLRGKCRHCGKQISAVHLMTESLCGLLSTAIYACFGMSSATIILLLLLLFLFTISLVDCYSTLLPDVMLLPAFLIFPPLFVFCDFLSAGDALTGFLTALGSSAGLRSAFFLLRRKEGLGLGDVKLFALAGALCGWQLLPLIFFLSAGLALLALVGLLATGRMDSRAIWRCRFPFGPFIAASLVSVFLLRQVSAQALFLF